MASDEKMVERVRKIFAKRHDVREQKMMSGMCFMVSGNMCCGASRGGLMVRVGKDGYEKALSEGHARPLEFGGRRPKGFVVVDPVGYESDAALRAWVQRGLDFVNTVPAKAAPAKKPGSEAALGSAVSKSSKAKSLRFGHEAPRR